MATQTELGEHYYLFRPSFEDAAKAGIVVISSHGGTRWNFNFSTTLSIGFYGIQNRVLRASLNTALDNPKEPMTGDYCQDYILSKYQGYHGGNSETYDTIKDWVDGNNIAVCTVRNRRSGNIGYLSQIIPILQGQRFTHVRCLFCRS